MKKKTGFVPYLQYLAFRGVAGLLGLWPINVNLAAARLLARLWRLGLPKHYRRAIDHLHSAYGDELSPRDRKEIAAKCLEHWTMFAVEVLCAPRLIHRWTWNRYLTPVNLEEALDYFLKGGIAILVTGHYGNWELIGHLIACVGLKVAAVMRPLDNVYMNAYLVRTRATHGLRLIDKAGAAAEVENLLKSGSSVAFIADQDAGRKGLFVDFFGRPASTYKSIGLLAMQTETPIMVGYARRKGKRFEYEVVMQRIIWPHEWRDRDDPLRYITQTYSNLIEQAARRDPAQYLWLHRRWKSKPPTPKTSATPA